MTLLRFSYYSYEFLRMNMIPILPLYKTILNKLLWFVLVFCRYTGILSWPAYGGI